jgi:hypothetical protein
MENESFPSYLSYDIQARYCVKPEGPITCPVCDSNLTESPIEPSKAMSKHIAGPDYYDYGSSLLFVCNRCHWWCVREHYEFVDVSSSDVHKYGLDYLIFSTAKGDKSGLPKNTQPWLTALDDLTIYDKVQGLPEKLVLFFRGGTTWKEYGHRNE